MKVEVSYPVVRTMEIEVPENLTKAYKEAEEKDNYDNILEVNEDILDYLQDTIPQIDADADYKPDIYDWDVVE